MVVGSPANVAAPAWASNNQYVAYVADGSDGRCLYTYQVASRLHRTLACGFVGIVSPQWWPQNTRLAFRGERSAGSGYHSWVINADGSSLTELIPQLAQTWSPAWVDEQTVAVAVQDPPNVFRLNAVAIRQPDQAHAITPEFTCSSGCTCDQDDVLLGPAERSPDGQYIAFVGGRTEAGKLGGCTGYYAVYLVDPAGTTAPSKKADIADTSGGGASASWLHWAADGQHLAVYGSGSDGKMRLPVLDVANGALAQLHSREGASWGLFTWAPDTSALAAGSALASQPDEVDSINRASDSFNKLADGTDPTWSSIPPVPLVDLQVSRIEVAQVLLGEEDPATHVAIPLIRRGSSL